MLTWSLSDISPQRLLALATKFPIEVSKLQRLLSFSFGQRITQCIIISRRLVRGHTLSYVRVHA